MSLPENLSGHRLYHFIGGRRHYNAERRNQAINRRYRLLFTWVNHPHMSRADLARHLGVSRSTITRDVQTLKRQNKLRVVCPLCGGYTEHNVAEKIEWYSDASRFLAR